MTTLQTGWQGRFFEDFTVGDLYRCRFGRTVTEADNIQFTLLTNNTNQIHFNRDYGEKSGFDGCLVNSLLTISIVTGMSVAGRQRERLRPRLDRHPPPQPRLPRRHPLLRNRSPRTCASQTPARSRASSPSRRAATTRRASLVVEIAAHNPRLEARPRPGLNDIFPTLT